MGEQRRAKSRPAERRMGRLRSRNRNFPQFAARLRKHIFPQQPQPPFRGCGLRKSLSEATDPAGVRGRGAIAGEKAPLSRTEIEETLRILDRAAVGGVLAPATERVLCQGSVARSKGLA